MFRPLPETLRVYKEICMSSNELRIESSLLLDTVGFLSFTVAVPTPHAAYTCPEEGGGGSEGTIRSGLFWTLGSNIRIWGGLKDSPNS